jgi:hypothetical protein
MVEMPSMSYNYLKEDAVEDNGKKDAGYTNPRILEADKVVHNAILQDPKRTVKQYLLVFPVNQDHGLDKNEIFSPNAENGKVAANVFVNKAT